MRGAERSIWETTLSRGCLAAHRPSPNPSDGSGCPPRCSWAQHPGIAYQNDVLAHLSPLCARSLLGAGHSRLCSSLNPRPGTVLGAPWGSANAFE